MKLIKIKNIKKIMRVKSGIRIVGSDEEIRIGGVDNSIIKDPLTGYPYIPGSSIKGNLRSVLEIAKGYTKPCDCGKCTICKLFGKANNKETENIREQTRIIVRDAFMTEKSKRIINEVLPFGVEIKKENTIDRVKGTAKPRTFDRIPAGVEFEVNIALKLFEKDTEEDLLKALNLAFKLVEYNYIGGSGSRGYGQVEFIDGGEWEFDVAAEVLQCLS
ncbi:type III-A CRISPR-associated RAMP protein Csm3 [Petroclostridium xylanilyticum]|jgi:CRISPR-associated protein Csm3|uniref:type III-A CRISPR-associated RAMP protein Csm3 n=1 Tax=Petroclostridium xylanilyticum TaxID=1792311 RepID=UPI000B990485|nr:type III-A CRISPR-associated RAMP protein Csm3 [Petroclostridium xylanilyticum]